ncbi:hypothetical protein NQL31_002041 [Lotmaria passim]
MLCTSYELCPLTQTSATDYKKTAHPAPTAQFTVERLRDVYLCASCPAVTEEWRGWPAMLHVVTLRDQTQPIPSSLSASSSICSSSPVMHEVSLAALQEVYDADSGQTGRTALQVFAVGTHSCLSAEVKAMVAGTVMAALRVHLAHLLKEMSEEVARVESNAPSDSRDFRAALRKCCRFVNQAAQDQHANVTHTGAAGDKKCGREDEVSGTWYVTWTPELLSAMAASASRCGVTKSAEVTVHHCKEALRSSLEAGVRSRLLQDQSLSSHSTLPSPVLHSGAAAATSTPAEEGRLSPSKNDGGMASRSAELAKCDSVMVRLTKCEVVCTHPLDVQRARDLGCLLFRLHLRPAQESAEDGTEAFSKLLQLAARPPHPQEGHSDTNNNSANALLVEQWQRALDGYHGSAVAAQGGVLFLFTHDVAAQGEASRLLPLRTEEERARAHVAAAALAGGLESVLNLAGGGGGGGGVKKAADILVALRLPGGGSSASYFNDVLLTQQWDTSTCSASCAGITTLLNSVGGCDAAVLKPARAALHWRTCWAAPPLFPSSGPLPHKSAGQTDAQLQGATLAPTPLQWVLYTLRRQLIVAVANMAQVLLTGCRLHLQPTASSSTPSLSSSSALGRSLSSSSCLRSQAGRCVKAQAMLRQLIRWHCPFPAASRLMTQPAVEELLWCLRLLGKLHMRAAALYDCVGDVASQQDQLRQWQAQLRRWRHRRADFAKRARVEDEGDDQEEEEKNKASIEGAGAAAFCCWSTSVEDVVGHVKESAWAAFEREVSAVVPHVQ